MCGEALPARLTLTLVAAHHGMCMQTNMVVKQFYDCLVSGRPLQDDSCGSDWLLSSQPHCVAEHCLPG